MKANSIFNTLLIAGAVTLAMPAQATLLGRDISGNAVANNAASAVFLYDTTLDITWLRDANYAKTSNYNGDGLMDWNTANIWANNLIVDKYTDWRLPTTLQPDSSCSDSFNGATGIVSFGYNCTGSEMGHLWYTDLGNTAGSMTNTGDFQNVQSYVYWSGTEYAPVPYIAWLFLTLNGFQDAYFKLSQFYALAVRPGDVAAASVPEPETLLLAFTALAGLGFVRRRQTVGALAI